MTTMMEEQTIHVPGAAHAPTTMAPEMVGEFAYLGGEQAAESVPQDFRTQVEEYARALSAGLLASPQLAEAQPGGLEGAAPKAAAAPVIQVGAEIGTIASASGYVYLDCLTVGPIQPIQPLGPRDLVAAGQPVAFLGFVLVNPALIPLAGISARIVLGGRPYRIAFQLWNKTTGSSTPLVFNGMFANPAQVILPVIYFQAQPLPAPQTGLDLYEICLSVDVGPAAQPFAAFNSWHFRPFGSGGLGPIPPAPVGFSQQAARFGVYDPTG